MKVDLIRYMPEPDELAGRAAAKCYKGKNPYRALDSAMEGSHHSVVEHAAFSFEIENVSRVLLAQMTRHRIASFSVESQRYCGVQPVWIVPQTVKDTGYEREFLMLCNAAYEAMVEMMEHGVPAEDARYIIPQGAACNLIVTMNGRELLHFFELRTCNRAQWEIRELADEMLKLCKQVAPNIFKYAGCGCVYGLCPEGRRSCGKPRNESEWETEPADHPSK